MRIGKISIEKPLALAPMEDVTEAPFRLICKGLGADLVYTEFTSSEALIRQVPAALRKIEILEEERPIGIQLFGGLEHSMEGAAKLVEQFSPDLIDINCGCWVRNHVARGEGAALLKDLSRFESIVRKTVQATSLPVTVKTRLGWDENSIVILEVAKIVEQAGAKALAVHCRTRAQAHQGFADWNWLEKIKKVISIPLIGNGDVNTVEDVKQMFETGCDGVMIGRGAIANPWIFQQAKSYMTKGIIPLEPSLREKIELCIEHLMLSVHFKGPRDGVVTFRKFYSGYLHGLPNVARLRNELMQMTALDSIIDRLQQFLDQNVHRWNEPALSSS